MNINAKKNVDNNQVFSNELDTQSFMPKRMDYPQNQNFGFQNMRSEESNLEQKKMMFINKNTQNFQNFNQQNANPYGNMEYQNQKKKFNLNYQNNCNIMLIEITKRLKITIISKKSRLVNQMRTIILRLIRLAIILKSPDFL